MRTKARQELNSERTVLRNCLAVIRQWGLQDHITRHNVGAFTDSYGHHVRFGQRGQSDLGGVIPEGWGIASGKRIVIEVKREGWKPPKVQHKREGLMEGFPRGKRQHWEEQLYQLSLVNIAGGYGFVCDDHEYLGRALLLIRDGYRVEIGADERPEWYVP